MEDQRAEVVAPRSGVVAAISASEGDAVAAGQTIVTLMDPRTLRVSARVDEGKIARVRPGQRAYVEVESVEGALWGRVGTLSPVTAASLGTDGGAAGNARAGGPGGAGGNSPGRL